MLLIAAVEPSAARAGNRTTDPAEAEFRALGMTFGQPQAVALTYEEPLPGWFRLQAHAFTVIAFTSVGARVIVPIGTEKFRPYALAGAAFTQSAVGSADAPAGLYGIGMLGFGLRLHTGRMIWFAEFSRLNGQPWGDESDTGGALGLLWSWEKSGR